MPRGGKRPNSGPKKGAIYQPTKDKALAREALRAVLEKHVDAMVDAQVKHAIGIKYLVKRSRAGGKFEKVDAETLEAALAGQEDGTLILEVWDKDPSVQAFTDLMNRYLDKPKEQEQDVKVDGTLVLRHELPE